MIEKSTCDTIYFKKTNALCPVCSSEHATLVGRTLTIDPLSSLEVEIWRCSECGHWTTRPMPKQSYLNVLYAEGSLLVLGEGWADVTRSKAEMKLVSKDHWILRDLSRFPSAGRESRQYLEIGPGDGALMLAFATSGWECHAVEPGNWLSHDGVVRSSTELPRDLRVDILVLHDVLEHCEDPVGTLGEYAKLVVPRGRIYLTFPNADSQDARWLRTNWTMVRPLGHLHYFSRNSIEKLLERCGLRLESARVVRLGSLSGNLRTLILRPANAVYVGIRNRSLPVFTHRLRLMHNDLVDLISRGDQWHVIAVPKNDSEVNTD